MEDRVIVLLDMDCFYVQVEERDNPHIKGEPAAVVQYNTWKGGGIIAVNYEARSFGVKRGMRGQDAKELCPSIHLVQVPVQREKVDLTKYRNAGKEVVDILCQFGDHVERASIDEAYIDFSKTVVEKLNSGNPSLKNLSSTWVVGHDSSDAEEFTPQTIRERGLSSWMKECGLPTCDDRLDESSQISLGMEAKLSCVAAICEQMRRRIFEVTGFKCSAGISTNKMLAKLACGLHKPNQQTILPMKSVPHLWSLLPVRKVRNLGGKLGDSLVENLSCQTMADLSSISLKQLRHHYDEKTALWLFNVGQGIDSEPVTARQLPKSIGCGKNFNGKEVLDTRQKVECWVMKLAEELSERLGIDQNSNDRTAKTLTVSVRFEDTSLTRSCSLSSYKDDKISKLSLALINGITSFTEKDDKWTPPIRNISLSAGKFDDFSLRNVTKIDSIFKKTQKTHLKQPSNSSETVNCERRKREILESNRKLSSRTTSKQFHSLDTRDDKSNFFAKATGSTNETSEEVELFSNNDQNWTLEKDSIYLDSTDEDIFDDPPPMINYNKTNSNDGFISNESLNQSFTPSINTERDAGQANVFKNAKRKATERNQLRKRSKKASPSDNIKSPDSPNSFFLQFLANKNNPESNCSPEKTDPQTNLDDCEVASLVDGLTQVDSSSNTDRLESPKNDPLPNFIKEDAFCFEPGTSSNIGKNFGTNLPSLTDERPGTSSNTGKDFGTNSPLPAGKACTSGNPSSDFTTSAFSVTELFPDLTKVDPSVLALFPEDVRSQMEREIQLLTKATIPEKAAGATTMNDVNLDCTTVHSSSRTENLREKENTVLLTQRSFEVCKECNRKIPKASFVQHKDYHFAMELRKQQLLDRRTSLVKESADTNKRRTKAKRSNNPRCKQKSQTNSNSSVRKIDSFFKTN